MAYSSCYASSWAIQWRYSYAPQCQPPRTHNKSLTGVSRGKHAFGLASHQCHGCASRFPLVDLLADNLHHSSVIHLDLDVMDRPVVERVVGQQQGNKFGSNVLPHVSILFGGHRVPPMAVGKDLLGRYMHCDHGLDVVGPFFPHLLIAVVIDSTSAQQGPCISQVGQVLVQRQQGTTIECQLQTGHPMALVAKQPCHESFVIISYKTLHP